MAVDETWRPAEGRRPPRSPPPPPPPPSIFAEGADDSAGARADDVVVGEAKAAAAAGVGEFGSDRSFVTIAAPAAGGRQGMRSPGADRGTRGGVGPPWNAGASRDRGDAPADALIKRGDGPKSPSRAPDATATRGDSTAGIVTAGRGDA